MNNVVIIGSGPAGLTAGIYLARASLQPIIIAGDKPGGQLISTDIVENYPGFETINGADLMMRMLSHAEVVGSKILHDSVQDIKKENGCFSLQLLSGDAILSRTIVIATGAQHKHLNIPGEAKFAGKGVSWCATCDGPIFRDKKVAVIGGGNTAVMQVTFLSQFTEHVFLIHRRNKLRAEEFAQKKLFANNNVSCLWDSEIIEIIGDEKVKSIKIRNNMTNMDTYLEVDGVFIAIGTMPSSEFVKNLVSLDEEGYVITHDTKTTCDGIFAAGDIVSGSLKQAVYAAGHGALVAKYVQEFLSA
ncbi:MAG: thioredoxin-disulfide reductase [Holosporales bacterium]|jgi:thioredoxin reductase (NADPH)|nr:thioredoxin-disulfide reductase [Holosporales bacterium]